MAGKLTPIERVIAGESTDRRRRYEDRMRAKGFKRITVHAKPEDMALIHEFAALSRMLSPDEWEQLMVEVRAIADRSDGSPTGD
jgi:hypothetical protein